MRPTTLWQTISTPPQPPLHLSVPQSPPHRATRAPPGPPPLRCLDHIAPQTTIVCPRTTPVAPNAQRAPPTPPHPPHNKPETQLNYTKRGVTPPALGRRCGRLRANGASTSVPRVPPTSTWRNWWSKHHKRAPSSPLTITYHSQVVRTHTHNIPVCIPPAAAAAAAAGTTAAAAAAGSTGSTPGALCSAAARTAAAKLELRRPPPPPPSPESLIRSRFASMALGWMCAARECRGGGRGLRCAAQGASGWPRAVATGRKVLRGQKKTL